MSDTIETYVQRAKRLKVDPTETCIACGSGAVDRTGLPGNKFCKRHMDWETPAAIECADCGYRVGLVCGRDK